MPSAKPKGKGGAASASPLSLAKKLCTAAHAAIRKEYNTRKPQKYKDHQAKIAEGKRRLEKLVVNVENAHYDDFRDFCEWVENDFRELPGLSNALRLQYAFAVLSILLQLAQEQHAASSTSNLPSAMSASPQTLISQQSPQGCITRLSMAIGCICDHLKNLECESKTRFPPEMYTEEWLNLLAELVKLFTVKQSAESVADPAGDILRAIVTDPEDDIGLPFIRKEKPFGPSDLGHVLFHSQSTNLSINMFRIVVMAVRSCDSNVRREALIRSILSKGSWIDSVREGLRSLLMKTKKTPKTNELIIEPELYLKLINCAAQDSERVLPQGYRMTGLVIDDDDILANDACQRRLLKDRVIAYVDHVMLNLKPYDEDGSEMESLFDLKRIRSFTDCGSGKFHFSTIPMDAASKSVNVKLTIHERDANAFVKFITECMKEKQAPPPDDQQAESLEVAPPATQGNAAGTALADSPPPASFGDPDDDSAFIQAAEAAEAKLMPSDGPSGTAPDSPNPTSSRSRTRQSGMASKSNKRNSATGSAPTTRTSQRTKVFLPPAGSVPSTATGSSNLPATKATHDDPASNATGDKQAGHPPSEKASKRQQPRPPSDPNMHYAVPSQQPPSLPSPPPNLQRRTYSSISARKKKGLSDPFAPADEDDSSPQGSSSSPAPPRRNRGDDASIAGSKDTVDHSNDNPGKAAAKRRLPLAKKKTGDSKDTEKEKGRKEERKGTSKNKQKDSEDEEMVEHAAATPPVDQPTKPSSTSAPTTRSSAAQPSLEVASSSLPLRGKGLVSTHSASAPKSAPLEDASDVGGESDVFDQFTLGGDFPATAMEPEDKAEGEVTEQETDLAKEHDDEMVEVDNKQEEAEGDDHDGSIKISDKERSVPVENQEDTQTIGQREDIDVDSEDVEAVENSTVIAPDLTSATVAAAEPESDEGVGHTAPAAPLDKQTMNDLKQQETKKTSRSHTRTELSSISSPEDGGDDYAGETTVIEENPKSTSQHDGKTMAETPAIASAPKKRPRPAAKAPKVSLETASGRSTRSKGQPRTPPPLSPASERDDSPVHVSSDDDYASPKSKKPKTTSRPKKPLVKPIDVGGDDSSVLDGGDGEVTLVDEPVSAKDKRDTRNVVDLNNPVEVRTTVDRDLQHKTSSRAERKAAREEMHHSVLESTESSRQKKEPRQKATSSASTAPESTSRRRRPEPAIAPSTPMNNPRKRKIQANDDEPLTVTRPASPSKVSEADPRPMRPLRSSSPVIVVHDSSELPVPSSDDFNNSPSASRFTVGSLQNHDGGLDQVVTSTPQPTGRKRKSAELANVFTDAPAMPPPAQQREATGERKSTRAQATQTIKSQAADPKLSDAPSLPQTPDERPSKRIRFNLRPSTPRKQVAVEPISHKPILRAPKLPTTYGTVQSILKELTEPLAWTITHKIEAPNRALQKAHRLVSLSVRATAHAWHEEGGQRVQAMADAYEKRTDFNENNLPDILNKTKEQCGLRHGAVVAKCKDKKKKPAYPASLF